MTALSSIDPCPVPGSASGGRVAGSAALDAGCGSWTALACGQPAVSYCDPVVWSLVEMGSSRVISSLSSGGCSPS
jgi:hypothetical protein